MAFGIKNILIISLFILVSVFISNINSQESNSEEIKPDHFISKEDKEKLMKEVGIFGKEKITKEEFKQFFQKFLFSGQKADSNYGEQELLAMEKMTEGMIKDVPDEFNASDLEKYFNQKRFLHVVSQILKGVDRGTMAQELSEKDVQKMAQGDEDEIQSVIDNKNNTKNEEVIKKAQEMKNKKEEDKKKENKNDDIDMDKDEYAKDL